MLSFVQFCVCMSTWNAAILLAQQTPPNIIWMWFDDLGIGDVSFMGGDVPTPILDSLVVDKAVKLNFHYTEPVCSASRSAFLTGRYAFKSGLNTAVAPMIGWGFNTANVLFTEILASSQGNNYNNMILGKWHVGRDRASRLPPNRGFQAGLYTPTSSGYYDYFPTASVSLLDLQLGPVTDQTVQDARDAIFANPRASTLKIRDTYAISSVNGNVYQSPEQLDATEYLEDALVDEAKAFIAEQDDSQNPFFVYYSLWTPHAPLAAPPLVRGTAPVSYSACQEAYDLQTAESCFDDVRCLFCAQLHYASLGIQDIVDEAQANANIDWSNTVLIVASDNGPGASNQVSEGSAMPLKGHKPYVFEGGIRTPAFMFGGLIESFTTSQCNYNEMVHISDWYHIFMDMIGVTANGAANANYNPDADHSDLSIWDNIQCRCTSSGQGQLRQCNNNNPPREELMTMRMCGDASADPQMYAAAIIKDGYKLIVNGKYGAGTDQCPSANNLPNVAFWYSAPGQTYYTPNSAYYFNAYLPVKTRMGHIFNRVLKSACLEDLRQNNPAAMDDASYAPFQYDEHLLYDIANDKIEACALDLSVAANLAKKDELLALLNAAQSDYDSPYSAAADPSVAYAAFQAMIESQPDCTDMDYVVDEVYLPPWADGNPAVVDYTTLWSDFVDNYQSCNN
eukprot:CAMPEP_0202713008 /NCGR_PEP_ID=MMETSP1385-20130828/48373_1 /ASSEMBLY_ACC=CAM_ASM_000861 /TAXON_ID=933848 /ORGANISM="Elphidium margaritaceum" /LENGTH=677 /DNA_ID=CAMNT_0049373225 /DNA_START=61 /DNA_END=2094 /DNA_ORIENTATION=+